MAYKNRILAGLLEGLDLGVSVAEQDTLLESARIETSAFSDLMNDRVDLIPGTKGSGKSALFRIFVDFLPKILLRQRKVIIAHGVQAPGDAVFHAFNDQFSKLNEQEFVGFWCIYLVSLAHEQFIKSPDYAPLLTDASEEIDKFRQACEKARIPEIKSKKSLKDILAWSLQTLRTWKPRLTFTSPEGGEYGLDLFGGVVASPSSEMKDAELPSYVNEIKNALDAVLKTSKLNLWLMVDRLDEIFPRRSELERRALRGLLRAMQFFTSSNIRVKLFLRDDMLEQLVGTSEGFTALTHLTARQADTLRWSEDQILTMIVKRLAANEGLMKFFKFNKEKLEASAAYRTECFYKLFPPAVYKGPKQSPTIRWICNRCTDGRGVITPRDVLDLLIKAKQKQQDLYQADPDANSEFLIGSEAIQYGLEQLSLRKRDTYLRAEFPHLWSEIEKFSEGKTDYAESKMRSLLGPNWKEAADHLVSIGFLSKKENDGEVSYSIPFLYRHGMNLTQGAA